MQVFPGFVHILFTLNTFCGVKWVKTVSKINMKYNLDILRFGTFFFFEIVYDLLMLIFLLLSIFTFMFCCFSL